MQAQEGFASPWTAMQEQATAGSFFGVDQLVDEAMDLRGPGDRRAVWCFIQEILAELEAVFVRDLG